MQMTTAAGPIISPSRRRRNMARYRGSSPADLRRSRLTFGSKLPVTERPQGVGRPPREKSDIGAPGKLSGLALCKAARAAPLQRAPPKSWQMSGRPRCERPAACAPGAPVAAGTDVMGSGDLGRFFVSLKTTGHYWGLGKKYGMPMTPPVSPIASAFAAGRMGPVRNPKAVILRAQCTTTAGFRCDFRSPSALGAAALFRPPGSDDRCF